MRLRAAGWVVVIVVATAAAVVTAPATPQVTAPSATALLSGTLLTEGATPQPVRRAAVRLAGADGTSVRLAGTDDQGRFVFPDLAAGTFTLSATKIGYVQAFHGSRRPGRGPGVPVAIADGQRVDVTFRMLPGAVITGTIRDSRGTPVPSVPVTAVEVRRAGAVVAPPARATTDDRGVYRIFGLAPGDYVISAVPRLGVGRGAIMTDIVAVTDAEVRWARGAGAALAPAGTMPPPGRSVTYAPVFYPGTTNAAAAATVSVAAGEERADVGFALQIVPTARIAGTIVDPAGQPVSPASVFLYPRRTAQPSAGDALISSGALVLPRAVVNTPDFSIPGVTPGDYTLVARTGSAGRGAAAAAPGAPVLWSVTDLTMAGEDQTNLILRLQPGVSVSGSIVFERSSGAAPADVSRLELLMTAVNPLVGAPGTTRGVVDVAGTFRFSSLVPGAYALNASPPVAWAPAKWTLKSAMLNGRDVADVLLDAKPGQDISGLVITFADRESAITGRLVDAGGRPVTRYSIVVFTVDRSLWLPNARRIRATSPATDGSFSVAGLAAGDYAIAAAEDVEASDLADPAFLSQLLASSIKITIAEGEKKTQDLRVGR